MTRVIRVGRPDERRAVVRVDRQRNPTAGNGIPTCFPQGEEEASAKKQRLEQLENEVDEEEALFDMDSASTCQAPCSL